MKKDILTMDKLDKMHKRPWRAKQRGDGYWYIEDANGHAIASIVTSCKDVAEDAAIELVDVDGYVIADLALKCTRALDYLDGMPERALGRRFDGYLEDKDMFHNIKGYIIYLEHQLGICK